MMVTGSVSNNLTSSGASPPVDGDGTSQLQQEQQQEEHLHLHHQLPIIPGVDAIEIDYEALPENASLAAHLAAGALAGIMEHSVMFPIDSIKTRMQILDKGLVHLSRSVFESISKIASTEGAYSLWKGVSSVIMGAGPAHAVYFSVFEATKTFLVNRMTNSPNSKKIITDENHPLIASGAGIAATTASDALMTPFDTIKQRMQALQIPELQKSSSRIQSVNIMKVAGHMYRGEGLKAFYISYPTTLLTNIPFAALNFGFYEYSSAKLNPTNQYNPYLHCVSGGIAGGIAAALTTPLDCIKTALQTKGIVHSETLRNINGFKSAVKAIYAQGGYKAFLRGLKPRIIFNVPSTAISWTAYEMAKEILIRGNGQRK